MIRNLIKWLILLPLQLYHSILVYIRPSLAQYYLYKIIKNSSTIITTINHISTSGKPVNLKIFTPNGMCLYRAHTFSSKEPETLRWIDQYGGNGITLFDIGANIGLYSLYYAARYKANVFAFEPSPFNLHVLAKNVNINSLQKYIKIMSNPVTDKNTIQSLSYSYFEEGSSSAAFGVEYGPDGKLFNKTFEFETPGFSLDFLISNKILTDYPGLIKLDVDGIEHLILSGAIETLKNPNCRTVLVEVSHYYEVQSKMIFDILTKSGFVLDGKIEEEILSERGSKSLTHSHNQIWVKPGN